MSEPMQEFCAAYGCPLLGSFGVSGKWYCCCHFNASPARNDAITLAINAHRGLADQAVMLRRTFAGYKAIKAVEDRLVELTREVGAQQPMQVAGVIGPTHATPHYTERDL